MADSGTSQMPIWMHRLLSVISSLHVHIQGKCSNGTLIPRIPFYLLRFVWENESDRCRRFLIEIFLFWILIYFSNPTWENCSFSAFDPSQRCIYSAGAAGPHVRECGVKGLAQGASCACRRESNLRPFRFKAKALTSRPLPQNVKPGCFYKIFCQVEDS